MSVPLLNAEVVMPAGEVEYVVLWMHGLGADGNDFKPIIPELKIPESAGVKFIFPHAPIRPVTINNGYEMRAWYDIVSPNLGKGEGEEDILNSVEQIKQLIKQEQAAGLSLDRLILAGFSQGGVIALHTALRLEQPIAGVIALSTYFPFIEQALSDLNEAHLTTPIFAAHGSLDGIVPLTLWEQYTEQLQARGFAVESKKYAMEHSVSLEEIQDLSQWLKARFQ